MQPALVTRPDPEVFDPTTRPKPVVELFKNQKLCHIGYASYGALGHVPPFDLQRFNFFQCTLTCTKSESDHVDSRLV